MLRAAILILTEYSTHLGSFEQLQARAAPQNNYNRISECGVTLMCSTAETQCGAR